ncbi:MAG: hypothetical protein Solivirus3_4 [Solivirus sp.]|uniref:DRBM domain-containing protein n=1 Tax=Solivirus sp. TaxID=2487772 RepID=A0A3G5AHD9_9VIRU|nr:MAG: hypothetical protein Solivirus3_4 [Solivirus sp.]
MNKRYPSDLQKRYANTVFPNLPNELIVEILINTDNKTFNDLCYEPEFQSYCSENSVFSERIYEERAKRASLKIYAKDLTDLKPREMTWREFYYMVDRDPVLRLKDIFESFYDPVPEYILEHSDNPEMGKFKNIIKMRTGIVIGIGYGENREEARLNAAKVAIDHLKRHNIDPENVLREKIKRYR